MEHLHRSRRLLAAGLACALTQLAVAPAEATVTTTTIQRSPAPAGTLVTASSRFSANYVYVLDKTGERFGGRSYTTEATSARFVAPESPLRAHWFYSEDGEPLSHLGWLAFAAGQQPRGTVIDARTNTEFLMFFEARHAHWHDGRVLTLRLSQPATLREEVLSLLPNLKGSPGCGPVVDWADGTLSVVTREIRPGEVRLFVKAHTEHPNMQRTARFDLEGELTLSLPSGWPKSFRSEGSWSLPGGNLRGEQTIRGTFQQQKSWAYAPNASPPLPLPAEAPKAP